jgi:MYXO-CTERM domain-containing protein
MGSMSGGRGLAILVAVAAVICTMAGRADAADVLIDFGAGSADRTTSTDALGRTWTNVTNLNDLSGSPHTLNNSSGGDSGYRLGISNPPATTSAIGFNNANLDGTGSPAGDAAARGYPSTATSDSLFGNTVNFDLGTVQAVRLTLSNLNPLEQYDLRFFASRMNVGDNRETEYAVTGGGATQSAFLNVANNTSNLASLAGVLPDANNQIVIDIDPGPNNTNANRFFYLGVMEVNSSPVPEPAGLGLLGLGGLALFRRRRA